MFFSEIIKRWHIIFIRVKNGFLSIFLGIPYLFRNHLVKYIIIPSFFSLLTGLVLIVVFYNLISSLFVGLNPFEFIYLQEISLSIAKLYATLPDTLITFIKYSLILMRFSLAFLLTVVLYQIFIPLTVIPFTGSLLSRIEEIELGHEIAVPWKTDINNTIRAIFQAILFSIIIISVIFLGLCLGPFDIILNITIQSYILGRGAFDVVFEKTKPELSKRGHLIKKWKPEIWGHGFGFFLLLLIPIAGLILAPVASIAGVARLYYMETDETT